MERWRQQPVVAAWDIFCALAFVRASILAYLWRSSPFAAKAHETLFASDTAHVIVGALLAGAAVLAILGLNPVHILPAEPFARFSSRRTWVARSLTYPAISPLFICGAFVAIIFLGAPAVVFVAAAYVALRSAGGTLRSAMVILLAGTCVLLAPVVSSIAWGAFAIVTSGSLVLELATSDSAGLDAPATGAGRAAWTSSPTFVREFAAFRYYQSDYVYFALSLAVMVFMLATLNRNVSATSGTIAILPLFIATPFSRILTNLLGTDTNAIPHIVRRPEAGAVMIRSRLILYARIMYVANIVVAIVIGWQHASALLAGRYLADALLFTELLVFCVGPMSIALVHAKPKAYSYIYGTSTANVYAGIVLYVSVAGLVYLTSLAGVVGVIIAWMGVLMFNRAYAHLVLENMFRRFHNRLLHV